MYVRPVRLLPWAATPPQWFFASLQSCKYPIPCPDPGCHSELGVGAGVASRRPAGPAGVCSNTTAGLSASSVQCSVTGCRCHINLAHNVGPAARVLELPTAMLMAWPGFCACAASGHLLRQTLGKMACRQTDTQAGRHTDRDLCHTLYDTGVRLTAVDSPAPTAAAAVATAAVQVFAQQHACMP
jgi:hypothetical protein